ncbi:MAG: hypothetical protein RL077_5866 [Verrucomicrobiota bacterium]|jgi:UDP-N-acetylmuramyl pentapeptide phosphotransferase/UDP-N-acetylglucosamine-1-phosphate transferase
MTPPWTYWIGIAAASWLLTFPVRAVLLRFGVVDKPNERSSHVVPTVRGAGIGIVLVVGGVMGWSALSTGNLAQGCLVALFFALAAVSFVDDLRGLGPVVRFLTQAIVAAAAVFLFGFWGHHSVGLQVLLGCVAWLWVAGYTNAFNFMDGINGLAAVQAIVTGLGTAAVSVSAGLTVNHAAVVFSVAVAGAALGFLPHNFPRARVFMGDVSSAPLGFLLAVLAVWIAGETSLWMLPWLALLHANFVLDTGITLLRRVSRGEQWYSAHREHFYQRLIRVGYSHTRVTLIQAGLQVVVVVAVWLATPLGLGVKLAVGVGVVALWLGFFAFAEAKFREGQRI